MACTVYAKAVTHEVLIREGEPHTSLAPMGLQGGACASANLEPTSEDLEQVRAATLCLVNQERALHGERPLHPNRSLAQAAQRHTQEMISQDYFEHVGPHGDTPLSRIQASGYIYSSRLGFEIGENIGWGTLELATPLAVVEAWIASPPHLANILNPHYRDTAIGLISQVPSSLAEGQPGATYTEDFGVLISG